MARIRPAAGWFAALAVALLYQAAAAWAGDPGPPREAQHRDLFSAITLTGHHCGAIVTVVENGTSDYAVQCRNGKRFRVQLMDGAVLVADETPAVAHETPGVAPTPSTRDDHRASVVRSLFAIVNLSGYDCDEVTRFERGPQLQYRVWCRNNTDYRISVRAGGRLEVAKLR